LQKERRPGFKGTTFSTGSVHISDRNTVLVRKEAPTAAISKLPQNPR